MGHLYTDMVVRGSKATVVLKSILIDTGATYTVLSQRVLEEVGAWGPVAEVEVQLGNGEKVKAKAYGVAIKIEEVEAPSISITFEGAQTVIGIETLESIGLKLDPTTGRLEFTRPKGMAYFYSCEFPHRSMRGRGGHRPVTSDDTCLLVDTQIRRFLTQDHHGARILCSR